METRLTEIADGVHQMTTYVPDIDFSFNQYLVSGDEPLLFHAGPRQMFPLVSEAVSRVVPVDQMRWISFGHVEADECGSMNEWLAAAPQSTVVQSVTGCMVSLTDLADRAPRPLADGEVLDIGGHHIRWIDTPHVPHAWEAGIIYDETTRTLFCGDLFTQTGVVSGGERRGPHRSGDRGRGHLPRLVARAGERRHPSPPGRARHRRRWRSMHGPAFSGDCRCRAARPGRRLRQAHRRRHLTARTDRVIRGRSDDLDDQLPGRCRCATVAGAVGGTALRAGPVRSVRGLAARPDTAAGVAGLPPAVAGAGGVVRRQHHHDGRRCRTRCSTRRARRSTSVCSASRSSSRCSSAR